MLQLLKLLYARWAQPLALSLESENKCERYSRVACFAKCKNEKKAYPTNAKTTTRRRYGNDDVNWKPATTTAARNSICIVLVSVHLFASNICLSATQCAQVFHGGRDGRGMEGHGLSLVCRAFVDASKCTSQIHRYIRTHRRTCTHTYTLLQIDGHSTSCQPISNDICFVVSRALLTTHWQRFYFRLAALAATPFEMGACRDTSN